MTRKLYLLVVALLAMGVLVSGCGDDDDDKKDDAPAATQTDSGAAAEAPAEEEAPAGEAPTLDEETLTSIIDTVNEDPAQLCDANNATAEFLESIGGEEACLEAAAEEPTGEEYTIDDLQIDGETATAVVTDADSTSTITFVIEGDQIKVASVE